MTGSMELIRPADSLHTPPRTRPAARPTNPTGEPSPRRVVQGHPGQVGREVWSPHRLRRAMRGYGMSEEAEKDPWDVVLNETFVTKAEVREPSARSRMLAEKWRNEPPVDPGRRATLQVNPKVRATATRRKWIIYGCCGLLVTYAVLSVVAPLLQA